MKLFVEMQKLSEAGSRLKISVPASKALVMTNKTKKPVIIYADQSAKVGYPLEIQESLEIETIPETCDFYAEILDEEPLTIHEGLFIVSQEESGNEQRKTTNNVIIQQHN